MQLIYAGKTQHCHPKCISFSDGFDVTHPKNHWSNETLAIQLLDNTIVPYVEAMREKLGLPENQKRLLIYNVFKIKTAGKYLEHLDVNNIAHVPRMVHKRGNKWRE